MPWGAISAAASVFGALNGSDAAGEAAAAQGQASASAIAEQRRQYDQNRADNEPWRSAGSAAVNRLAVLMGLRRNAADQSGTSRTWQALYDEALSRAPKITIAGDWASHSVPAEYEWANNIGRTQSTSTPDTSWARAEADRLYSAQNTGTGAADSGYGDLIKKFTMADRDADPVYQSGLQFGLDEGTKAINSRALMAGNYDSGATLKALTRFGNDYGSTKANESRNRFVSDQDSIYNRLAGISGNGQTATAQVNAAGQNMANNVSNLVGQAGNARAAGIVGGANAWSNGISNAIGSYNNSQILQKVLGGGFGTPPFNPNYTGYGMFGDYQYG